MYSKINPSLNNNPFGTRPWLKENGAAAAAGGGNMGLKGIIAGTLFINNYLSQYIISKQ